MSALYPQDKWMEQFQASKQVLWQNQYVLCKMFDSALENGNCKPKFYSILDLQKLPNMDVILGPHKAHNWTYLGIYYGSEGSHQG